MAQEPVETVIQEYVELLKQRNVRVAQAILFGSDALGTADEDSDIDVAIISPDLGRDRFSEGVMGICFAADVRLALVRHPERRENRVDVVNRHTSRVRHEPADSDSGPV